MTTPDLGPLPEPYMLGLPVVETPDFDEREHSPQRTAWEVMEAFFEAHGCTAEMFPPNVEITGDYLASGTTTRGTSHMVVMRGGKRYGTKALAFERMDALWARRPQADKAMEALHVGRD